MKRRGFLRALLSVAAAPVVAQAAALLPTPQPRSSSPPPPSQSYETYTFRRDPGFFESFGLGINADGGDDASG